MGKLGFLFAFIVLPLMLIGCGISPESESALRTSFAEQVFATQAAEFSVETRVAGVIYATQTAAVPTATIPPSSTPTKLASPTPRPSLTLTPLPLPDAQVLGAELSIYDGPSNSQDWLDSVDPDQGLVVIGQLYDCSWLKVITADGVEGWINAHPANLVLNLECASLAIGSYRPLNGMLLTDQRPMGGSDLGELNIENGTSQDGLVVVTYLDDSVLAAVYVRAYSSHTLYNIPDDTYWIYIAQGSGWDESTHQMVGVTSYDRFEETFPFESDSSSYTIWSITLQPVAGGTGETEDIDPQDFPDLGGS